MDVDVIVVAVVADVEVVFVVESCNNKKVTFLPIEKCYLLKSNLFLALKVFSKTLLMFARNESFSLMCSLTAFPKIVL